ncbi:hypothetical protein BS17DRAFT_350344 [Gyrodon lividus]|nr:hypothetical protein BS17DRAFT_350344 [Gyrodon lividus]
MVTHNFVGDKPVDSFPPEAIQKDSDVLLTRDRPTETPKSWERTGGQVQPHAIRRSNVDLFLLC